MNLFCEHLQQIKAFQSEVFALIFCFFAKTIIDDGNKSVIYFSVGEASLPEILIMSPISDSSAERLPDRCH